MLQIRDFPSRLSCAPHLYFHECVKYLLAAAAATAAAKSLQSCLTLCNPIDGSPPGSPVHGILQAGTLKGVAISFSNAGKWKVKVKLLSRVWLFVTPWTAAYQAPPSMGFSTQEYWHGLPLPSLSTAYILWTNNSTCNNKPCRNPLHVGSVQQKVKEWPSQTELHHNNTCDLTRREFRSQALAGWLSGSTVSSVTGSLHCSILLLIEFASL